LAKNATNSKRSKKRNVRLGTEMSEPTLPVGPLPQEKMYFGPPEWGIELGPWTIAGVDLSLALDETHRRDRKGKGKHKKGTSK
jgi:hypothetical protein